MVGTTCIGKTNLKEETVIERRPVNLRAYIVQRHAYLLAKRVFDIAVSLCVLVFIFSWLFPILYILIKLDSKGPVFFVQTRVGFLGRSFPCLKFRTMRVNAEANTKQATDDDPRITRMGRFLRHSNLDELPQFLNVLAGHMSIVGPRPHMYKDCANFSRVLDSYKFRSVMKPGITGLAQVNGCRGETSKLEEMEARVNYDLDYLRRWTPMLDIKIILMTVVKVFRDDKAY